MIRRLTEVERRLASAYIGSPLPEGIVNADFLLKEVVDVLEDRLYVEPSLDRLRLLKLRALLEDHDER